MPRFLIEARRSSSTNGLDPQIDQQNKYFALGEQKKLKTLEEDRKINSVKGLLSLGNIT
jgi:hypothetical protein